MKETVSKENWEIYIKHLFSHLEERLDQVVSNNYAAARFIEFLNENIECVEVLNDRYLQINTESFFYETDVEIGDLYRALTNKELSDTFNLVNFNNYKILIHRYESFESAFEAETKRKYQLSLRYTQQLYEPEWHEKRLEVFALYGRKCTTCGTEDKIQVHHKTYIDGHLPWEYDLDNFTPLCQRCHSVVHNKLREEKQKEARELEPKEINYNTPVQNRIVNEKSRSKAEMFFDIMFLVKALKVEFLICLFPCFSEWKRENKCYVITIKGTWERFEVSRKSLANSASRIRDHRWAMRHGDLYILHKKEWDSRKIDEFLPKEEPFIPSHYKKPKQNTYGRFK